ncbi:MAG: dihydropteroate synthase [Pseudomonadota bacterium]
MTHRQTAPLRRAYTMAWGKYRLELGARTCVMGIVNVTPDSFSDGGRFFDTTTAIDHALALVNAGADILDIGGESTRPFAESVDTAEEIARVVPVIKALAAQVSVPISIDTTKAAVARQALEAGASIINDVSALRMDEEMAPVAAKFGVPVILMHMLGSPRTMQVKPTYTDVVADIRSFLAEAIRRAVDSGIPRRLTVVDPGIGFGKTTAHNLSLIGRLSDLSDLDVPVLVGPSRKAFIRQLLKTPSEADIQPDSAGVEMGTQAAVAAAVMNGAHIVRVHNVANTRKTVTIIDALRQAEA